MFNRSNTRKIWHAMEQKYWMCMQGRNMIYKHGTRMRYIHICLVLELYKLVHNWFIIININIVYWEIVILSKFKFYVLKCCIKNFWQFQYCNYFVILGDNSKSLITHHSFKPHAIGNSNNHPSLPQWHKNHGHTYPTIPMTNQPEHVKDGHDYCKPFKTPHKSSICNRAEVSQGTHTATGHWQRFPSKMLVAPARPHKSIPIYAKLMAMEAKMLGKPMS